MVTFYFDGGWSSSSTSRLGGYASSLKSFKPGDTVRAVYTTDDKTYKWPSTGSYEIQENDPAIKRVTLSYASGKSKHISENRFESIVNMPLIQNILQRLAEFQ